MPAAIHLITGKGGTGRSTTAIATTLALRDAGARVMLLSLSDDGGLERAVDELEPAARPPVIVLAGHGALEAFLTEHLPARVSRRAARHPVLATLFRAAPGTEEITQLDALERWSRRTDLDHLVIDGEASGHTLLWLDLPRVFGSLRAGGVLGPRLTHIAAMVRDPRRFVVHATSSPSAWVAAETRALAEGLTSRGVARGAMVWTETTDVSLDASAVAALEARSQHDPMSEDLRHLRIAVARDAAARQWGALGFGHAIAVPWIDRHEADWGAALLDRGRRLLPAMAARA